VVARAVCGERLEGLLVAAARKVRDVVSACRLSLFSLSFSLSLSLSLSLLLSLLSLSLARDAPPAS